MCGSCVTSPPVHATPEAAALGPREGDAGWADWSLPLPDLELVTPPLNGIILPGVVRQSLLDLGRKWVSRVGWGMSSGAEPVLIPPMSYAGAGLIPLLWPLPLLNLVLCMTPTNSGELLLPSPHPQQLSLADAKDFLPSSPLLSSPPPPPPASLLSRRPLPWPQGCHPPSLTICPVWCQLCPGSVL